MSTETFPTVEPVAFAPVPEPVPIEQAPVETPPVTIGSAIRLFVVAVLASIATHCNSTGKEKADEAVANLKNELGDSLTPKETAHLDSIFANLQEGPAPVKSLPAPPDPNDDGPVDVVYSGPPPAYPQINAPAKSEQTFNSQPINEEAEPSPVPAA
jgi:hypothetical protein